MKLLVISGILFLTAACGNNGAPGTIGDPNGPVAETLTSLTTAVFNGEQPALNSATAMLPLEAQALVQAAYAALEAAVVKGEGALLRVLVVDPNGTTTTKTMAEQLNDIKIALDALIH